MSETKTPEQIKSETEQKLKVAKDALDSFKKEYVGKVYPIKATEESLTYTKNFMEQEAEFKGTEALGVINVCKALDELKPSKLKNGVFFLKGLEVQALCYFMERYNSKGRADATNYIEAYKPVNETLQLVKKDNDEFNNLSSNIAVLEESLTMGIAVEETVETEVQINS